MSARVLDYLGCLGMVVLSASLVVLALIGLVELVRAIA